MSEVVTRTREEVITRWVEALESGKYKQGAGQLRSTADGETSYCCLGVLCKLAEDDGGQKFNHDSYGKDFDIEFPPRHIQTFVFDEEFCESLAEMNDEGASFKRIAGVIRAKMAEEGIK